jgi:benzodiazapine receptor
MKDGDTTQRSRLPGSRHPGSPLRHDRLGHDRLRDLSGLVASLILVAAVAAIGGHFAPTAWYQEVAKPPWTPPGWLFAPVWTVLYILMGVAAWLVWRERAASGAAVALGSYVLQLVLNALWSWIFFGLHRIGLALLDLIVLWALIVTTGVLFWRVRRAAGGLLVPYVAWVSFAGSLNYAIWVLNR